MRKATLCFLLVLFCSWCGYGQSPTEQSTSFPRVVATFKRWNQTDQIPEKTLFTPTGFGVFRVSVVLVVTVGNNQQNSHWVPTFAWTDGSGREQWSETVDTYSPTSGGVDLPLRDLPSKPIRFEVSSVGDTTGSKYNVFVVVEQLM